MNIWEMKSKSQQELICVSYVPSLDSYGSFYVILALRRWRQVSP